jgi:putative MATE family efflux protein
MLKKWREYVRFLREALTGEEKEFTSGSINRAIFLLSIPMVLEMLMEGVFAVVDIFFVSRLGKEATATVGLTEGVMAQIMALSMGLSMAATAMVARRIGEKNREGAAIAAVQVIYLGIAVSIIMGVVFYFTAEDILRIMGGSPELIRVGSGYTRLLLSGSSTMFFIFLLNAIFRGAGDAAIAMRTLILANGCNIVLCPLFIFGLGPFPELGVTGAAVATTTGRGIGVLYQLWYLFNGRSLITIKKHHLKPAFGIMLRLMRVASTGVLQHFIPTTSWVLVIRIIAIFGDAAVAGYSIGIRIFVFTILPAWGMSQAASTLVGQNLGAGQPDRAETSVWRTAFYNMMFLTTVSIVFFIFAPQLVSFFTHEAEVTYHAIQCLRIVGLGCAFYAFGMVISQSFSGAGDTVTPSLINLVAFWGIQIPLSYVLAKPAGLGPEGVFWGIAISESLLAVFAILIFRRGKWKNVKI